MNANGVQVRLIFIFFIGISEFVIKFYPFFFFTPTIIYKETLSHELKELARLEGSFPSEYIEDIIDKLEKE